MCCIFFKRSLKGSVRDELLPPLQVQMVSSMRIGRNVNYRILDIDWCTSDKVVLASDDGCIRVLEMAMKSASYRMDEQDLTGEPRNGLRFMEKFVSGEGLILKKWGDLLLKMTSTAVAWYLFFLMFRSSVVSLPAGAPSCPHSQGFPPAAALVGNLHHGHHSGVSFSLNKSPWLYAATVMRSGVLVQLTQRQYIWGLTSLDLHVFETVWWT